MNVCQREFSTTTKKILEAMEGHDWLTRKEIAQLIGKKICDRYDVQQLHRLRTAGLVEVRHKEVGTGVGRYFYRSLTKKRL
jgi:predicted DNA-binding ArsR family transcriptional regulator